MRGPEFIITQFSYDTLGRRISKTTYDYLNNSHTLIDTLSYVYAGEELLSQTKNGTSTLFISSFQDTDDILAKVENGNISYFHKDHLGSIVAITNNSGTIVAEYSYDAFGKVRNISGDADFENTILYTGREYDKEIGLYFYRARYYDPELGRFISQDPIGIEDDINLYAYVGNNPVNFTDPSGEKSKGVYEEHIAGATVLGTMVGFGVVSLVNEDFYYGNIFLKNSISNKNNIYNPGDGYTKTFMKSEDYTELLNSIKNNIQLGILKGNSFSQADKSTIGLLTLGHYDYQYEAFLNQDGNYELNIKITDTFDFNYEKDKKGFNGWYLNTMNNANNYGLLVPTKTEINIKDLIIGKGIKK